MAGLVGTPLAQPQVAKQQVPDAVVDAVVRVGCTFTATEDELTGAGLISLL